MDEERKLKRAKINLMRSPKFALLSGLLMVGKTSITDDPHIPCAATNGRDELYARSFVRMLDDAELAFVIAHEAGHKMYRHLTTWAKLYDEDNRLANAACDYVINLMLHDLDPSNTVIRMPRHKDGPLRGQPLGLLDVKFRGMNTKQVFDKLKEEQEEGGGGGCQGFDEHQWGEARELSDEEKEQLERELDHAIRQGVAAHKKAGEGNGHLNRSLTDLLAPKINWREMLREFVKASCTAKDKSSWRKVNRRFLSADIYMPSLVGEKVGHLVIGIDTSGSVGERELADFLSGVKGIAEEVTPDKVDLLYWDTQVAAHEEYDVASVSAIVHSTKPAGGGGTAPRCVSTYLKEKDIRPECVVMLTDGYVGSDWGEGWQSPLLWVVVGGNDAVATTGKTIHVRD